MIEVPITVAIVQGAILRRTACVAAAIAPALCANISRSIPAAIKPAHKSDPVWSIRPWVKCPRDRATAPAEMPKIDPAMARWALYLRDAIHRLNSPGPIDQNQRTKLVTPSPARWAGWRVQYFASTRFTKSIPNPNRQGEQSSRIVYANLPNLNRRWRWHRVP